MRTVKAWHFRQLDGTTAYLSEAANTGEWYSVSGEIVPCVNGFHASKYALDALGYADNGAVLAVRVELRGEIKYEVDKLVARERKDLWLFDATKVLKKLAGRALLELPDVSESLKHYIRTGKRREAVRRGHSLSSDHFYAGEYYLEGEYAAVLLNLNVPKIRLEEALFMEARRLGLI